MLFWLQAESSRYKDVLALENKDFLEDLFDNLYDYYWLWSSDYWFDSSLPITPNTSSSEEVYGDQERQDWTWSFSNAQKPNSNSAKGVNVNREGSESSSDSYSSNTDNSELLNENRDRREYEFMAFNIQ